MPRVWPDVTLETSERLVLIEDAERGTVLTLFTWWNGKEVWAQVTYAKVRLEELTTEERKIDVASLREIARSTE